MSEISILAVKPGQLREEDRAALREIGVVVVEVSDPADIRFLRPAAELSSSEMLGAALTAITRQGGTVMSYLGEEIAQAVLAKSVGSE